VLTSNITLTVNYSTAVIAKEAMMMMMIMRTMMTGIMYTYRKPQGKEEK
jgi:hypothetical protein